RAAGGLDAYNAFAYIVDQDTGFTQIILDRTGVYGAQTSWAPATVTASQTGNYKFVFISGSWDDNNGGGLGGSLYLDNLLVNANTPRPGTVKTLNINEGGKFTVGEGVKVNLVDTSGVGQYGAETGIYRLSGDADAKTLTLKRYDVDGETLMGSETISNKEALGSGRYRTLEFAQMGVSLEVENLSDRDIFLGDLNSGLDQEITIASSKMASLIGEDGPTFQTGHSAYSDVAANLFKDTRMGKNTDAQDKDLFNQVGSMITDLAASSENASTEAFNNLYNKLGDLLDEVSARRSNLGAMQNRLQASINNVNEQAINLEAAQGQIMNTDYAAETARMTRMQIGQQAATAMLAQANQLPNVILALLQ
ncbi:MAG: hypothetical protein EBT14_08315, partial [Betaproteobacteria bacterium]|nr:hypothetical protein [Betaproteobacteria bacterium]